MNLKKVPVGSAASIVPMTPIPMGESVEDIIFVKLDTTTAFYSAALMSAAVTLPVVMDKLPSNSLSLSVRSGGVSDRLAAFAGRSSMNLFF